MALEMLSSTKSHEHYLDVVPELPWERVGGQEEAQAIKDAIELRCCMSIFSKISARHAEGIPAYGLRVAARTPSARRPLQSEPNSLATKPARK